MHYPSERSLDTVIAFSRMPITAAKEEISRQFLDGEISVYEFANLALDYLNDRHDSDCALHNGPESDPMPCSCGVHPQMTPSRYGSEKSTSKFTTTAKEA